MKPSCVIQEKKVIDENIWSEQHLRNLAHEINNVLLVISGNLELIERRIKDNAELEEMINDALKSVDHGKCLTQQALADRNKKL